jgi:hypothetical protein
VAPYELAAAISATRRSTCQPRRSAERIKVLRVAAAGAVLVGRWRSPDHAPDLSRIAAKRPVGMVHFDAHSDTNDRYFGDNMYTHGTPFRRAVEEGLLDPKRVVQIGIRGRSMADDMKWA